MKMKKKVLSAAVVAAMGIGSAQAVNLSQDGTGEVLIFPYYTVNGGHKTLISVVNTTDETKAVKVRFREGKNSREVLDFNLYLSPEDVWVGTIQDDGAGGAKLTTSDNSCTVPQIPAAGKEFVNYAYASAGTDVNGNAITATNDPYDGGGSDMDRTREGYVEMIEMGIEDRGDVNWANVWDNAGDAGNGRTDSTHNNAGIPDDCAGLVKSWTAGEGGWEDLGANTAIDPPTGGLFGMGAVINVEAGSEAAVVPTVLASFSNQPIHFAPGNSLPTLANATPAQSVVLVNDGVDQGLRVFQDTWVSGADAVSAVLQAHAVMNQFTVNPNTEAETAWVVTFPTKHFYADHDTDVSGAATTTRDGRAPFTNDYGDREVLNGVADVVRDDGAEDGMACEAVLIGYVDREEQGPEQTTDGPGFSPQPVTTPDTWTLCNEVNVVNFGDSDVLSSELLDVTFNLEDGFVNGWAALFFQTAPDGQGHTGHTLVNEARRSGTPSNNAYRGLPVIGFRVSRLGNSNVGAGAAYDVADQHKYERQMGVVADPTNGGVAGDFTWYDANGDDIMDGATVFDQYPMSAM